MALVFTGAIVLVFTALLLRLREWKRRRGAPYPPGPKGLPLVGNIFDVPKGVAPWIGFRDWSAEYGSMIYFTTIGKPALVLNSYEIAHDLLDKRSAIYSSRPPLPMANDVVGWKFALTNMDYNETWKRQRRYLVSYFGKTRLHEHHAVQLDEARRLLRDLARDPADYRRHVQRMGASIVLTLAYGHRVDELGDPFMEIAEKGVATINAVGVIGAHIIDFVPWLRFIPDWMPGGRIKWTPPGTQQHLQDFLHVPFNHVKNQIDEGTAVHCYTADLLAQTQGKDDDGVLGTAALIYSGGLDTTVSTLMTAFYNLATHPTIQDRLQDEMDAVVGIDRLPSFDDVPKLPYLRCVISEAMRFAASTPVGVPHRLAQDDTYNGFFIPAGTMVMANQWAMLHDPLLYPNPEAFDPDRFLADKGRAPQLDPREIAFGFGRRICPGLDVAENTICAFVMSVFYAYRVSAKGGGSGPVEFNEGTVRHPKPMEVEIVFRRGNMAGIVADE